MSRSQQTQLLILSAAAGLSLLFFLYSRKMAAETTRKKKFVGAEDTTTTTTTPRSATSSGNSASTEGTASSSGSTDEVLGSSPANNIGSPEPETRFQEASFEEKATPLMKNTKPDEKEIHARIEEFDKKGKALFKNKQYLEAAQAFTEALEVIESQDLDGSGSLARQVTTLLNNRSAMYEKGDMPELSIEDCCAVLEKDMNHSKARARKLRVLEGMKRWQDALVEVCALQLLFMKTNRTNLQMGLPVPPPPVPQSKMEELLFNILPSVVEKYTKQLKENKRRALPSSYTILQLLRSYTDYNSWMAAAAKDGSVEKITGEMPEAKDTESTAKRATLLMKRGRRHVYDGNYEPATDDLEEAYALVGDNEEVQDAMEDDSYSRMLEWTGMVRHWHYELGSAFACYQKCANLEPMNTVILVKQAGVQMDSSKHEDAMKLFDMALGMDATTVDAMLHRSNLLILQGKHAEAKIDLERCLELRPNHVMARLRLATILAATDDPNGAREQLDLAERENPKSSEIHSHRGELYFTQGQMEDARKQFEKAIELEPNNPTPYVNAAMALLNTPTAPGQIPDAVAVMDLLEKAIDVDPQFSAAYMQLGQLALGTATDLNAAREVISLYDRGLENCRSEEEIRELCSMRVLAVAQVDAATMLKMETFNMQ